MEWFTAISQLLGHIAWPAALITLVIMFRREIRQRLAAVTEVKYPGGAIIMREVERLEAKVEDVTATSSTRQLPPGPGTSSLIAPHSDSRLAIAQMRLDVERELFLVSRHALSRSEITGWPVERYLEELEKAQVLDPRLADSLRDFIALANMIVHKADVPEAAVQRASAVGSSLVATLRRKRLVLETEYDFWGHGLWHMRRDLKERENRYYLWSAVAASLPTFDYDYDVYREALERHNARVTREGPKAHAIDVLSLDEFVSVLEFRESELLRIIGLVRSGQGWGDGNRAIEWRWPSEWGNIGWTGPILREKVYLWGAEEDLMRTRAALSHYRQRLLGTRRS
ncbi:MAG: hypothetical protein HYY45_07420, partial [Deltaproteobacteria bacterium]|nr:hypothetical protein [Deltaproteobacteria bacterium]